MNNFNKVFESKLRVISSMVNEIDEDLFTPTKGTSRFNIDVFKYPNNGIVKIITGIKTNPQGISITEADYYMLVSPDETLVVAVSDIKAYIKSNIQHLKSCMDDKFKYIGFEIPYTDFKMLSFVVNKEEVVSHLKIAA